jgi:hypothetical protein
LESVLGPWFTPAGGQQAEKRMRQQAEDQEREARRQFEAAASPEAAALNVYLERDRALSDTPPTEIERRWLAEGYQVARIKMPDALGTLSVAHDGEAAAHSADYKPEPSRAERIDQLRDGIARDIEADREQAEFAARVASAERKVNEADLDAALDAAYDKRSAELAPGAEPFRAPSGFIIDAIELDGLGSILRVILRPA